MTIITLKDLQELGRIWKGVKGCRPLTKEEIEDFGKIPEGAVMYPDYESYLIGNESLVKKKYQAGCDKEKGLFWTLEL